jgi:VWFA-related protein
MTHQRFPLLAVVLAASLSPGVVLAQAQEGVVYASVLDDDGLPVAGLTEDDFIVREDGQRREVLRIMPATDPMRIAVLVDTSTAAQPYISDFRTALRGFFKEMHGRHDLALFSFGERPTRLTPFTRDLGVLQSGVDRVFSHTQSGAYVLDAIIEVSRELRNHEGTRTAIVVITSDGRELSQRDHHVVLSELQAAGTTLHLFTMSRIDAPFLDDSSREREQTFAHGTRLTGGRREDLLTSHALPARLQLLATELENQHRIVYSRPAGLVPPRTIDVKVNRSGVAVRAPRAASPPRSTF